MRTPRPAVVLLLVLACAPAASADWSEYRAIVWQAQKPGSCTALKEVGIDAGAVIADRERPGRVGEIVAPLRDCGLSWYVENIATDFYSAYHRYSPDKPVNWRFVEAKKAYRANPLDPRALIRDPSLSDPGWQERIRMRLTETVSAHRAYRPLFYNLGDEPAIADLSAFWDFDYSRHSLEGMRRWLAGRYGSLDALNAQWGTRFADWSAVVPQTTAEAMKREDGNYSAWADFKEWMDAEFARAIALGARAVRAADPGALAAIEGAQAPGWGGYDYSRLATAVDLVEPYDDGGNVEILRSLNPRLVLLGTSFGEGAAEAHYVWRALLRGSRGVVFWDPQRGIVGEDGRAGRRGRDIAPHLKEIKSGIGALLIRSERRVAPVAILYSPASMRAQWMLDWRPRGTAWSDRDPSEVYEDPSAVRSSMKYFFDALGRGGLEARVLTPERIERGALRGGVRVLVLPRALALSAREAAEIRGFVEGGGTVVADGEVPGRFDEHCRLLPRASLADLFRSATSATRAGRGRAFLFASPSARLGLMAVLAGAGVEPPFRLERRDGARASDVEAHLWRDGETTILALQREPGRAAPETLRLQLRESASARDLRSKKFLGTARSFELSIDPVVPTLLELKPR